MSEVIVESREDETGMLVTELFLFNRSSGKKFRIDSDDSGILSTTEV